MLKMAIVAICKTLVASRLGRPITLRSPDRRQADSAESYLAWHMATGAMDCRRGAPVDRGILARHCLRARQQSKLERDGGAKWCVQFGTVTGSSP
jgi:hypothetical protein